MALSTILHGLRRGKPAPSTLIGTRDGTPLAQVPLAAQREMDYLWARMLVRDRDVPRSVGVTSQVSGEGVSFISRALAVTLARVRHTCLVEANWWSEGLPLDSQDGGFASVLAGSASVEETFVATNHPGLSIIPAGTLPEAGFDPTSIVDRLATVLDEMQHRFDHVVLDLPAIGASSSALPFAAAAEAALLVARQRVARVDGVSEAIADLGHARFLGVVVNSFASATPGFVEQRLTVD